MKNSSGDKSSSDKVLSAPLNNSNPAIEAAEERFSLLVDSVKDYGIFLIDQNGFIQSWNSGAERIKGYTADEVIGKHFSMFYTTEDIQRKHPDYELRQALQHGKYEEEGWRVRKNGTKFWSNVVITTLTDKKGKHVGFAKVTRDLTEKKEAEERLKYSEERLRKMFEGIKDYAMIMLDTEGKVTSWNEGARRIKGYEADEIIGQSFKKFYSTEEVQMGKCDYELHEAAETGRFEDEGWRIRKDGTKFWASVLITAIRDANNKLIGFSKVTRDITDRKRAEDLLKMAYNSLEKRVEERTIELIKTNNKLKEAIETRDDFLSIASHELRTPLTPLKLQIQSFVINVKKGTIYDLPEERLVRMGETCERAISRLSSLIDNLLDVSRINSGKIVLNSEHFDLVEMARELIERHKAEIINARCTVIFNSTTPVWGTFDKLRIEQVFLNLLTNAIKYGNKKPIEISVIQKDKDACMIFQDKGVGISEADKERIFKRFERVVSDSNIGGLGLGLYITNQIVEAHKGHIEVESIVGEGSRFTVCLPMERPV